MNTSNTNCNEFLQDRDNLLTGCERSMRYHHAREQFFNRLHLGIQYCVFAFALASVAELVEMFVENKHSVWVWAAIGLLSLFSLVFNPAKKAYAHRSLYRDFALLAADIEGVPEMPDEETLLKWKARINIIYSKEPPIFRALNEHCRNQTAIALGDEDEFKPMWWYYRLCRNWIPFQGITEFSAKK